MQPCILKHAASNVILSICFVCFDGDIQNTTWSLIKNASRESVKTAACSFKASFLRWNSEAAEEEQVYTLWRKHNSFPVVSSLLIRDSEACLED